MPPGPRKRTRQVLARGCLPTCENRDSEGLPKLLDPLREERVAVRHLDEFQVHLRGDPDDIIADDLRPWIGALNQRHHIVDCSRSNPPSQSTDRSLRFDEKHTLSLPYFFITQITYGQIKY